MTRSRPVRWLRARTPVELAGLGAAALVLGWLGWDLPLWDARQQLALHLVAGGVLAGLAGFALRGAALPRTPLDLPILALLAAYAAATATAMNHGVSLRAVASVLVTAAVLPVALLAVRHRPGWAGVVASVPVLALAIPSLAALLMRRAEWVLAGAPGLPPLRLLNEGTLFGSVAVPPFVIWPAWALAGLIEAPGWRRPIRIGLVAVGVPLTVLSGSRSAWLAIGVALVVAAVPWLWRRRRWVRVPRRVDRRQALTGLALLALGVAVAVVVVPRLTAVASLLYRATLWRDTLAAWATDPLLGIGPGFMPFARQAAAPDFTFPVAQPHSHNVALGVLGDAGVIGLVAGVVVVAILVAVAGPWRSRTAAGRNAATVLIGIGIGSLFEDLTFLPNFNVLAIGLVAVALSDAGAVSWNRARAGAPSRAAAVGGTALMALALAPAVVLGEAGAVAHRAGVDAAGAGRHTEASEWFARAERLDPWHPAPPKALAVAADVAGDRAMARAAAARAVARNPGDGSSWTNLAVLCEAVDDPPCRVMAAERAAATASFLGVELANAALAFDDLGMTESADDAYRRSLLSQRLTAFALEWPRDVALGDTELLEDFGTLSELNRVLAAWDAGEPIDPTAVADPAVRALAHAIRGERDAAAPLLEEAIAAAPEDPIPWQLAIVLRDHWGEPVDAELRAWHALTGRPFAAEDQRPARPQRTDDLASFRGIPGDELVTGAERLETDPIWPWVLARALP